MGIFLNSIFPIIIISQFVAAKYVLSTGGGGELNSLDLYSTHLSDNGEFSLGFFTIQSTNLTYLGIWYTEEDTIKVWVANRDNPMNSSASRSALMMIDESGTLKVVIKDGRGTNTTLFNVSNGVVGSGNINTSTIAVLEDSGNLVLYADPTRNRILWQSFDYPTDTLLPGMKLGYNLTTGQNWTLTSWLSDQIPASGAFTMKLEQIQNSPHLVIYRRGKLYWSLTVSLWRFGTLVSDDSGMYFAIDDIPMLQLSSMGRLMDGENNLAYNQDFLCYQNNNTRSLIMGDESQGTWNGDCANSALLPYCRSHYDYVGFDVRHGVWFENIKVDDNSSISLSDCMERCWNDCNCKAFYSGNSNGTGCITYGADGSTHLEFYTYAANQIGVLISYKKNTWIEKTWKWILISASVFACAITGPLCYVRIRKRILQVKEKRRRDKYIHQLTVSESFNYGDVLEKGIKDAPDIKIFSFGAILAATENFSIENKLGQGGYGPVYKGKLFDGREIAVKRLSKTSGQGIDEFKSELILISKLQHTNLVRLYGCCIYQEEKMLIYEFMPNKSLDFFLFVEDKKGTIYWRMRFNIIEGVAQGLLYLHKYSRMRIIHRDLKVSNVLLDENMNPKIADFGMARIFQQNETEAITNRVVGTYGYMAPEYAIEGTFSIKSDVFSFGVLILEIVSGKRNSRFHNIERPLNLVGYAWELWKEDAALELKDEALDESCDLKQLLRTIHVGLLCVQDNADDRPTMLEVISMLNNEIADLPNPRQPMFIIGRKPVEDSSSKNIPVSVNGLSITMMEAR